MKKYYRFLAFLVSFVMICGTPLGTLSTEAASVTEEAAEEAAGQQAPDVEEKTEENGVIHEETVEETGIEAETRDNSITDSVAESVVNEEPAEKPEEAVPVTKGDCGEQLTWEYDEGILSIKGIGKMYAYDEEHRPEWLAIVEEIRELRIGKDVTYLDADAFESLTKLDIIRYEGSEKAWKELEKEWEDEKYIEEKGKKEIFSKVREYYFGEEDPEEAVETPRMEESKPAEEETPKTEEPKSIEEEPTETEEPEIAEAVIGAGNPTAGNGGTEDSLRIVTEPQDASAAVGARITLHVEVNSADVFYQWQWSLDGKTWKDCTSAGSNTGTFSFVMKETMNGRKYRCIVFNDSDEVLTREAAISIAVNDPLEITEQPGNVTASAGETVSVHVEANKADAAYQWQWSRDGKSWNNCTSAGSNTDTFSFVMKETLNGRRYRCVVTSGDEQVTSEEAVVTYVAEEALEITKQPEDVTGAAGETVSVHVEANKADAAYQWQWSADEKTWKNCTSAGSTTDTFSFAMKATLSGRHYRCIVTSGSEQVISGSALVSCEEPLKITEQPENITAGSGVTVQFHVEANKADASYQWQWSADGKTWKDCTSAGSNTDTFSFTMKESLNRRLYHCIVTSGDEQVISSAATLTFEDVFRITKQPEDVSAAKGVTVNFHVEANRTDVTYQWQWSADGKTWKNCTSAGCNTDTFSFVMKETLNGRKYRCNVTNGTETVASEVALLIFEKSETVIDGVVYELIDGKMTVTGYRGSADAVMVQETVDGHTVTVIGESAFEGSSIKSIDLPDTIQLIRKRAFANCSNLTKMT